MRNAWIGPASLRDILIDANPCDENSRGARPPSRTDDKGFEKGGAGIEILLGGSNALQPSGIFRIVKKLSYFYLARPISERYNVNAFNWRECAQAFPESGDFYSRRMIEMYMIFHEEDREDVVY